MIRWIFSGFVGLGIALAQPASQPSSQPASQPTEHAAHEHAVYTCPMHPQIVEDQAGTCPICGMDLVPKKVAPAPASAAKPAAAPGVTIDPVVVQNMGVRLADVRRGALSRRVRTVGNIKVAEDRQSVVNLRFSGWIERLRVRETGVHVKKGQALFDVYSPELVSAQQEYLIAVRTGGEKSALAKSAKRRLQLYGVSKSVIREVAKKGPRSRIIVRAPRAGFVVHHTVVEGARVAAGKDLYRIADLSQVWVEADIYEHDAPWVHVGAPALLQLSFQSSDTIDARVDYIYPTLNPKTRTVRVRLVIPNAALALKPGSFATVEIDAQRKADALLVPTEAIIHSGVRTIVFVAHGQGRFEAREITTGLVGSERVTEVVSGLTAGEQVVTSGQFLLDSESQLSEAVQKMLRDRLAASQAFAPPDEADKDAHGQSYWTCSMDPQVVEEGPGSCPICGMGLVEKRR